MRTKSIYRTTLLASAAALSACGGNSNPSVTEFTSVSNLPVDGVTEIDGVAVTAQYTSNLAAGTVAVGAITSPSAATAVITTEADEVVVLNLSAPGSSVAFDTNSGDTPTSDFPLFGFVSGNSQSEAFFVDPIVGFEYQTFGLWLNGLGTGSGNIGAGSFGAKTASGSMPSGGTASYSGLSTGFLADGSGTPFVTASAIDVSTDFTTATITSSGTQKANFNTGTTSNAANLDFSGTGSVSSAGFSTTITGTGVNGSATGDFYGPLANEVGGVFSSTGSGGDYAGSFGAN